MEGSPMTPDRPFQSPEEELAFLRERLDTLEARHADAPEILREQAETPAGMVREYQEAPVADVLPAKQALTDTQAEAIVLDLAPEAHDEQMSRLLGIMQEKGIKNALAVVDKMDNLHLEDDFHRFLVEYIKKGYPAPGLKSKSELWKSLSMTLYEVTLPRSTGDAQTPSFQEMIAAMEQLYAGLFMRTGGKKEKDLGHFSLELAVDTDGPEAIFYIAVPDTKRSVFEKQILSLFPQARIAANNNDYNVFNPNGVSLAMEASLKELEGFPLKAYGDFDHDPLTVLLSSFSKFTDEGEGAALQIVVQPGHESHTKRLADALDKIKDGDKPEDAFGGFNPTDLMVRGIRSVLYSGDSTKDESPDIDSHAVEHFTKKIAHPVVIANIRLVTSAATEQRAKEIMHDLAATFHQFEDPQSNSLVFKELKGTANKRALRDFAFRNFSHKKELHLNLEELATLYHLPTSASDSSRELKRSKVGNAPAPLELGKEGVLLGINSYSNVDTEVRYGREDRVRHFYSIGQTGTGKTGLMKNMIVQDIRNGDGVCMIDPHGSDIQDILGTIPRERWDDVIYFDPSHAARPMGLNMLEYDPAYPEQKTFVVNELFSIFQKLYGGVPESMGPMFEQYFRNATMLVIEDPQSGNTLLDVSRVLADENYRKLKLSRCGNPVVKQFWEEVAGKAGGEAALANIVPYITSKFDVFLANDVMRPIVAQSESAFDFREIMDGRKILLVNLAKGRLGDINSNLLGLIIVGKILMAALSRVDSLGGEIHDFYLYIDEFQNVTTDSIATILSEARKYRLSLNVAHQFIAQLDDKTKDAVFGNVGSICTFRVGADDAQYLESQFAPVFSASDLMNVDNYNAYLKMLANGKPVKPFNIATLPPESGDPGIAEQLKAISFERFGRPRDEIEAEVMKKYHKEKPPAPKSGSRFGL